MADYDIAAAFDAVQTELFNSMMRNMKRHRNTEDSENVMYAQWQVLQIQALNEYIQKNPQRFKNTYKQMNAELDAAVRQMYETGRMDEEIRILKAVKHGYRPHRPPENIQAEFFTLNERALNALADEAAASVMNAQTAILRRANDEYRKAQFNAQVYFNSGAGTLGKAVDMAVHDMLLRGLACVEYKDGRRVSAAQYSEMVLRTAKTRAYLQGEASMRDEWGVNTVIVKSRSMACPKCIKWVGRVYYDDVWGHIDVNDDKYPRLSEAIKGGLYHPNCKDIHMTYFEGITDIPEPLTADEIQSSVQAYEQEQRAQYIQRNMDKYARLARYSTEPENREKYRARLEQWKKRAESENKSSQKTFTNTKNDDIIKSGAISGALNPDSEQAYYHADRYYRAVRHMTGDVDRIANNTGLPKEEIQQIKEFIFLEKHDLGNKELEYFAPSYEIGQSWQRLIDGKNIQKHDITLLNHEIMERELILQGMTQEQAHIITSQKYNYGKEAKMYYDKIKKYK